MATIIFAVLFLAKFLRAIIKLIKKRRGHVCNSMLFSVCEICSFIELLSKVCIKKSPRHAFDL